jgi:protein O-GlcNAc transferase
MLDQAMALLQQGRLADAERVCAKVLRQQPRSFDALHLSAIVALQSGNISRGAEFLRRALRIDPNNADAHRNLGSALHDLNLLNEAVASYGRAIQLAPQQAESYIERGAALYGLKRLAEALEDFDKAIALRPDSVEAYGNRGIVLRMLNRPADALASYERGLALDPRSAQLHCNRGNMLYELKRLDEALSAYDKALSLQPDLGEAWVGRGNAYADLQRFDAAFAAFERALSLNPRLDNAWLGRANSLSDLGRQAEAVSAYERALTLNPDLENAWLGRGSALYDLRRFDEALTAFDKAFQLRPDLISAEGARLNCKMTICDWRTFEDDAGHVVRSVRNGRPCIAPFAFLAVPSTAEDQLRCAVTWVTQKFPKSDGQAWRRTSYRHDKIRVAYVSADLHQHAVALVMAGVFEHHDRSRFATTAISTGPDDGSDMRKRLEQSFDRFRDVRTRTDDEIASEIVSAEIDILIDLGGFTRNNRTGIFSRRPAPIQVSYLGYPGTMGAGFIDYIVSDTTVIPQSHRPFYAEKVIGLPHSYLAIDNLRPASDKAFTRAECGLPQDGFVFCCFNNNYKILPATFDSWMRVLAQVQGSVLWLVQDNDSAADNLRREATTRGISPDRLIFATRLPPAEHLARQRLAGLFLDTFPYNAHTTASDAVWVGLPVLTRIGETFVGRVAASLLNAIGLPELITQTQDAYEKLAIELAMHPDKLAGIKSKLAANRLASPLFDTARFTRHIERAYEAIHERQQSGLPPEHIDVAAL